jgi:hypothetical protein
MRTMFRESAGSVKTVIPSAASAGFMQRSPNLLNMRAMSPNSFVELVTGHAEGLRPIVDVGRHLGVDLFGVVGALGVVFVDGVGLGAS